MTRWPTPVTRILGATRHTLIHHQRGGLLAPNTTSAEEDPIKKSSKVIRFSENALHKEQGNLAAGKFKTNTGSLIEIITQEKPVVENEIENSDSEIEVFDQSRSPIKDIYLSQGKRREMN